MPKPPITEVIDTMYTMYADYPETELQYETPFQLLIAVIMSAQTTDKQVNVVTQKLYHVVKTPQDVLDLGLDALGEYVRFVGLWKAKAKNIWKTAQMLVATSEGLMANGEETEGNSYCEGYEVPKGLASRQSYMLQSTSTQDSSIVRTSLNLNDDTSNSHPERSEESHEAVSSEEILSTKHGNSLDHESSSGGRIVGLLPTKQPFRESPQHMQSVCGYAIPDTLKGITQLPGVGTKTAKVVLAVLYGQARIAVDTHVHRVSKRLGRVRGNISADTTSTRLEKKIPDEYKRKAHRSIIYFGRYHCTAKNPKCKSCPFMNWCPEGKIRLKKSNI